MPINENSEKGDITYCCDCDNSFYHDACGESPTRNFRDDPHYWRCRAIKLPLIKNLVTGITARCNKNDLGGEYVDGCDYARCQTINEGFCKYFKPKTNS